MRLRESTRRRFLGVALALAGLFPASAWGHLLITEVGYDPVDETGATAEFVEILNPGPGAVSLANVWLANDEEAYPLLVKGPIASGITLGDFVYGFPAITLVEGEIAVVCHDSDAFMAAYFPASGLSGFLAQAGNQTLIEVTNDGDADGVPGMIDYGSNPPSTLSLADNGECVGLATWDGVSDLVADHDWVCWRLLTYIPNKSVDWPFGIDGPDPGLDESFFKRDLGNGIVAPDAPEGSSINRTTLAEPVEVQTGGNGVSGHDETTEDWSGWTIEPFSPGVTALPIVGVGPAPLAVSGLRLALAGANPWRGSVEVRYALPRAGIARLTVHDVAGRWLATLHDGVEAAGEHRASWDGRDVGGAELPAGLYFARLGFEGEVRALRIIQLR